MNARKPKKIVANATNPPLSASEMDTVGGYRAADHRSNWTRHGIVRPPLAVWGQGSSPLSSAGFESRPDLRSGRDSGTAVKRTPAGFADHPPTDEAQHRSCTETGATTIFRELLRGQHVPVFDLYGRTFPQLSYCRGCFVCPAGGTHSDISRLTMSVLVTALIEFQELSQRRSRVREASRILAGQRSANLRRLGPCPDVGPTRPAVRLSPTPNNRRAEGPSTSVFLKSPRGLP
jgi:hypothetical protein